MKRLVVVERNPHIRSLLEREFVAEGYQVSGAANEQELLRLLDGLTLIDLLILDPGILDSPSASLCRRIKTLYPHLPIIMHALNSDIHKDSPLGNIAGRVEKNWGSIVELKKVTVEILHDQEAHYE
jgi:DNA-binding response OmpR family regulator